MLSALPHGALYMGSKYFRAYTLAYSSSPKRFDFPQNKLHVRQAGSGALLQVCRAGESQFYGPPRVLWMAVASGRSSVGSSGQAEKKRELPRREQHTLPHCYRRKSLALHIWLRLG